MKAIELYGKYRVTDDGVTTNIKTKRKLTPYPKYKNGRLAAVTMTLQTPNGRKVYNYARFIFETFYGQELEPNKHVKHKNGNKLDFRYKNLYAIEIQDDKRIRTLEKLKERRSKIDARIKEMEGLK